MKLLIFGDTHTDWTAFNITIARAIERHPDATALIQVGDLGYAWPKTKPFSLDKRRLTDEQLKIVKSVPFYWIDGNHENHDQLDLDQGASQPGMTYCNRGTIIEHEGFKLLFFGGASSIDKHYRTEHVSWWRQESITDAQIRRALEKQERVDIMFSHDYPAIFPYKSYKDNFGANDRNALETLRLHFRPRFSVFGHHHEFQQGLTDGTHWACAPCIGETNNYIVWDGESLKHE